MDQNVAKTSPTLSVIVPVYKVEDTLEKCVSSILNQSFQDFEIILVDDGSPDQSGKMCDEFARNDSRVVVIHKPNGGLSSARNKGLESAKGKYISFVDSDDRVSPDFYESNINILEKDKTIDVVLANVRKVTDDKESSLLMTLPEGKYVGKEACNEVIFSSSFVSLCMGIYRHSIWEELRFTEKALFEDSVIVPSLARKIDSLYISEVGTYFYLQRSGSIMNSQWTEKKAQDYFGATLGVLEYLAQAKVSNYPYRYAGAVYELGGGIFEMLPEKTRDNYLAHYEQLPCTWEMILKGNPLPLKHRIYLLMVKLLGLRKSRKLTSLLLPEKRQKS
ncbi:glycosyltransferase family 2 protein [Porphyromonas sp.]|uniref:glycosyltransferase family 2 protein n=1 Tax=Porphyromonas sp. TaxID=1924944 RepID=UPI0026DABDB3|nr:glycosyltransferase family 2 protein [Porphyromonas sp.]MDO4695365.1 glycosyltransferase family 2 protein [Porphyromonas sp.]MDO4770366.1 glycosyltransferase family 2 protein [Porphyromonas sp.]